MSFQFNPPAGLKDKTIYPKIPANEDAARAQIMEPMEQLRDHYNVHLTESEKKETLLFSGNATSGTISLSYSGSLDDFDEIVVQIQPDVYDQSNFILYPGQNLLVLDATFSVIGPGGASLYWISGSLNKTNKTITINFNRYVLANGTGYESASTKNKIQNVYGLKRGV